MKYYSLVEIKHGNRWISPFGMNELSLQKGKDWIENARPSIEDFKFAAVDNATSVRFKFSVVTKDMVVIKEKTFETRLELSVKEVKPAYYGFLK